MKKAGEEAEVETDCINGVVGFIIKYSYFYFFSQEKAFPYSSTFRLISILLIICTFPFSLFVTVKMVQVVTQNINKFNILISRLNIFYKFLKSASLVNWIINAFKYG